MIPYLEVFYRHRVMVLTPLILSFLIGTSLAALQPRTYAASAKIWIDPPIVTNSSQSNLFSTPADQETAVLQELLTTRTFCIQVAHRGPLADYLAEQAGAPNSGISGQLTSFGSRLPVLGRAFARSGAPPSGPALDDLIFQTVSKNTVAVTAGPQIVSLTFNAPSYELAAPTAQAIVDEFSATVLADKLARLKAAVDFYQPQVTAAQADLAAADAGVTQYLSQHAELRAVGATPDSTLTSLNRSAELLRQRYAGAAQNLQQAEVERAAASQPGAAGFRVIDRPIPPTHSTGSTIRILMGVGGGLGAGLMIAVFAVVLMKLGDRTVRLVQQLEDLGLEVAGTTPSL